MEWAGERIQVYGGDKDQLFLLVSFRPVSWAEVRTDRFMQGYGSGAHIALLTVVQDAVVRSRDEHFLRGSPYVNLALLAPVSQPATNAAH
jgi:hypothetical protein